MEPLDRRIRLRETVEARVDRDDVGSQKYVVGAPRGPKSRGGLVMVLGGTAGATCAAAVPVPATIVPAPAASAWTSVRRDNVLSCFSF